MPSRPGGRCNERPHVSTNDTTQDPRDHAFWLCEHWGPDLRVPKLTRLRTAFPDQSQEVFREWLVEFDALINLVWELAGAGGPFVLGEEKVREALQTRFSWLASEGLKQALFLVAYYAWHEGYDRSPLPSPGTV